MYNDIWSATNFLILLYCYMYVSIESLFVFVSSVGVSYVKIFKHWRIGVAGDIFNKKNVNVHDHIHVYHFICTSSHIV